MQTGAVKSRISVGLNPASYSAFSASAFADISNIASAKIPAIIAIVVIAKYFMLLKTSTKQVTIFRNVTR